MFGIRGNVRNTFTSSHPLLRRLPTTPLTKRAFASKVLENSQLNVVGPVAEKLARTDVWVNFRKGPFSNVKETAETETKAKSTAKSKAKSKAETKTKTKTTIKSDKSRVNIVSENLCDDIFSYIGPSLDRHKGCDIIDIYPGVGLWSRKLNEYLEPRSHILMEPDAEFYKPFLKPLLKKRNTTLVPASGIVWRELGKIITPEYLPHQVVPDAAGLNQRNDTLLVTANLAFHPKKRYLTFESVASLVLYQFIETIRSSSLFQRYGLVRMLIWTRPDDKHGLIPKMMQKHKKLAIDSELSCEWVNEVCGREGADSAWFVRDTNIDFASSVAAWKRMQAANINIPEEREPEDLLIARTTAKSKVPVPGRTPPYYIRPFQDALSELETANQMKVFPMDSAEFKKLRNYRWRQNAENKRHRVLGEQIAGLDALTKLHKSGTVSPEEIKARESEWLAGLKAKSKGVVDAFITYKDNLHFYRQDPPLLNWDRRPYEPLTVLPEEFFPNIDCSLLDIQPKAVSPLLRQTGPNSNRARDTFELLMSALMRQSTLPVGQLLDSLMPGASDYILPRWKSSRDADQGGVVVDTPYTTLTPRMLNAKQWMELLELWMEWPFRPQFHELVARTHDELTEDGLLSVINPE
ncbi:S-adenosyl-L-methionine-dependent methyltransferase [Jackrogersella minutella]|nr:S-adenosyl-L-methionine-dependent methyltransferase [Jackrogersella minutella]